MNLLKSLNKLGLQENVDFQLETDSFVMLPKTSLVEQTPAVYDEAGNLLVEAVMVEQSITPVAPTNEQLQEAYEEVLLDENDIVLLIELFLADKQELRDVENDSINIVNNRIYSWNFANIAQPTKSELVALVPALLAKNSKEAKLEQIKELEAQITPRRIRESILNNDNSFIASIDAQITAIRATL